MRNYILYSDIIGEQIPVKCHIPDIPKCIEEFAQHYGIDKNMVKFREAQQNGN